MSRTDHETQQIVVKFAQELLLSEEDRSKITPEVIAKKIDLVVAMQPSWGERLDRVAVTDELIRRFSLWIGQDTTLKNDAGHNAWLDSTRKHNWRYWQRYREWLERDLSWKSVEALNQSTDSVLGLLEDPLRPGPWDRRGLVVGHVQSGKTSHYTGLIAKAADAGYKIIIVLAGLHNNLRAQTQIRLEEGFLGYRTSGSREQTEAIVGVGEFDGDRNIHPNCATNRANNGDFSTRIARHLAISPEERPWLFVVKKNKTVLRELLKWIQGHAADITIADTDTRPNYQDDLPTVRKKVTKLPLLVVDDEADHASVDTQEQTFDSDGNPDDEHQPTTINRLVRRILHSFSRASYVGYTATPFANIFIHERGETRDEGLDLFPSAFIVNLATPSNYIGPARVFGLNTSEARHPSLPLVRTIEDHQATDGTSGWMPNKHPNFFLPRHGGGDTLPPSLVEAIDSFVLTCAVRRFRGQGADHSSMLVHVTRFTSVQSEVHRQVERHVLQVKQRITRGVDSEHLITRLRRLWESDFVSTTAQVRHFSEADVPTGDPTWAEIESTLADVVGDIEVRIINGSAKDVLDYSDNQGRGLKVIAIGGDKLSRGLTLEGLCVSYFLRASRMYDTLMQMGRWFGYRPKYLDLCRLYTTEELSEWFGHITDAAEELREEFDQMAANGATPKEYGLKVQSHPVLMVTSRLKMRTAKNLMLSFSGQLLETVSLYREVEVLRHNFQLTQRLVSSLEKPEIDPVRVRTGTKQQWKGFFWENIKGSIIVDFMSAYRTHRDAYKVNSLLLAEYIRSMNTIGELDSWSVAVIGGGEGAKCEFGPRLTVEMLKRANARPHENRYSIGRLLSPRDEAIDLDSDAWQAAMQITCDAWRSDPARLRTGKLPEMPSGLAIRKVRGFGADTVAARPDKGLLLLYALDPRLADDQFSEDAPPIIAFGVSFPGSTSGVKIEYKVNNVLWEQEYGPAD